MKDLIGSDRFGFERILMQILVPGMIALGPFAWMLYLVHRPDPQVLADIAQAVKEHRIPPALPDRPLMTFAQNNKELAVFVVLIFAVVAGLVIEDIGSWMEKHFIDRWNRRYVDRNLDAVWEAYLKGKEKKDEALAVMPSYMTGLVPRMKFQLSICIALLILGAGLIWLWTKDLLKLETTYYHAVIAAVFAGALIEFFKARSYCALLHRNRVLELMARGSLDHDYDKPAKPTDTPALKTLARSRSCCRELRTFNAYAVPTGKFLQVVEVGVTADAGTKNLPPWRRFVSFIGDRKGANRCTHHKVGLNYMHPSHFN